MQVDDSECMTEKEVGEAIISIKIIILKTKLVYNE